MNSAHLPNLMPHTFSYWLLTRVQPHCPPLSLTFLFPSPDEVSCARRCPPKWPWVKCAPHPLCHAGFYFLHGSWLMPSEMILLYLLSLLKGGSVSSIISHPWEQGLSVLSLLLQYPAWYPGCNKWSENTYRVHHWLTAGTEGLTLLLQRLPGLGKRVRTVLWVPEGRKHFPLVWPGVSLSNWHLPAMCLGWFTNTGGSHTAVSRLCPWMAPSVGIVGRTYIPRREYEEHLMVWVSSGVHQ